MITIQIKAGLGNQLFQWGLGCTLSRSNTVEYDTSQFNYDKTRSFALHTCGLDLPLEKHHRWIFTLPKRQQEKIAEKSQRFDKTILSAKNCILDGYWQSEKYLEPSKEYIRRSFNPPLNRKSLEVMAEIYEAENPVSIHVRLGDNMEPGNDLHPKMTQEYYNQAIDRIFLRVKRPTFFVFSDEPEKIPFCIPGRVVNHNRPMTAIDPGETAQDMFLQSICQHHILAHSTFSWWAAWLGETPDSITIAPEKWFRRPGLDSSDLIPDRWLRY